MIVALAARRAAELTELAKEIGGKAFTCDATKRVEVAKLFADVETTFGALDVVVYNASYRTRGPFIELDPADVEKALAVTAFGGFLVAQKPKSVQANTRQRNFFLAPAHEVPQIQG
jgi:NAD(P)-dependent dehydrogenase (short-subunit alcohol dehydrogenase family)